MTIQAVDFAKLIEKVQAEPVGQESLSIWGGQCPEANILTLIKSWPNLSEMPYRIWEHSSAISFEENTVPDEVKWLERGRLFGSGGNLSLRRDGERFLWHFVGKPGLAKPPAVGQPQNFWEAEGDAQFYQNEETALLWGEYREGFGHWFDDRAAQADLDYPASKEWQRVQVKYHTYSRAGRVEFVWFYELEEYKNG